MGNTTESAAGRGFVADEMLGKLTRLLRMAGLDIVHKRPFPDEEILKIASEENRIVLTRDNKIIDRKSNCEIWKIEDDLPFEQFAQVVTAAKIDPRKNAFTRCIVCNTPLLSVSKDSIAGKVPPLVFATQSEFNHCGTCDKYYWRGTHRAKMEKNLADVAESISRKK